MQDDHNRMDVVEVYSPERVIKVAREICLRAGWSFDLTTTDELGNHWNFDRVDMRNKAIRMVLRDIPIVMIGSPHVYRILHLDGDQPQNDVGRDGER